MSFTQIFFKFHISAFLCFSSSGKFVLACPYPKLSGELLENSIILFIVHWLCFNITMLLLKNNNKSTLKLFLILEGSIILSSYTWYQVAYKNMYLKNRNNSIGKRKEQRTTASNFKNTKFKTPDYPYATHTPA